MRRHRAQASRQIGWDNTPPHSLGNIPAPPGAIASHPGTPATVAIDWLQSEYLQPALAPPTACFRDEQIYAHAIRNICCSDIIAGPGHNGNEFFFKDLETFYYFGIHVQRFVPNALMAITSITIANICPEDDCTDSVVEKGMNLLKSCTNLTYLEINLCALCHDYHNGGMWNLFLTYRAPPSLRAPTSIVVVDPRNGVLPPVNPLNPTAAL